MASVYNPDNFQGRVAFACAYMLAGRNATRTFETCFEMADGDVVCEAIRRRAEKNPRLSARLPKYLNTQLVEHIRAKLQHLDAKGLVAEAKRQRERFDQSS